MEHEEKIDLMELTWQLSAAESRLHAAEQERRALENALRYAKRGDSQLARQELDSADRWQAALRGLLG